MNLGRLFRTVRHLKVRQIVSRVFLHLRRIRIPVVDTVVLAKTNGKWVRAIRKPVETDGEKRFALLNQEVVIDEPSDWNRPDIDKLLLYHLHYHDALLRCDNARPRFLDQWISDNPPADGNGWEPYPLSLRIVNWIKWHLEGNRLDERALLSLYLQASVLFQQIEYHLMANHLFANAKALYFAGLFFDDDRSRTWLLTAESLLQDECAEQILGDGGHFELSPMYHSIITEDILDLVNVSRVYGRAEPAAIGSLAPSMIQWLRLMSHGDGEPSYFNDATIGVAPTLQDIEDYGKQLGIQLDDLPGDNIVVLQDSGYVVYRDGETKVIFDAGNAGPDYQPGHAHCDCLSIELSHGKNRLIVNSGISTYNVCDRRHHERATEAHNTVSIEGVEQNEIWSAFRVGRRLKASEVYIGVDSASASHDGFLTIGTTHERQLKYSSGGLEIADSLDGSARTSGLSLIHFYPGIEPVVEDGWVQAGPLRLSFVGAESIEIENYDYSLGFNKLETAKVVRIHFRESLRTRIVYENSLHS